MRDVPEIGAEPEKWIEAAQDRQRWRGAVEQTYGRLGPGHL